MTVSVLVNLWFYIFLYRNSFDIYVFCSFFLDNIFGGDMGTDLSYQEKKEGKWD